MARGRIALLLGQADEAYQSELISGVEKQAFAAGYDVCVFSMYIKYQNSREREKGDSNIFNLINFNLFDAVIVLSDTIQTPGVENAIEERLHREYKGKVLCIDHESKYFPFFWADGYKLVYKLVSHFIEEHDMKDIAYLTGRKEHAHSQRRLEAYIDAMKDHDLPVDESRIFYGDFWYTSGNGCAEILLRNKKNLPEAVICANDCMAIGLAEELERRGVRIPEDIAIAGYGTTEEGQLSPASLTSTVIPAADYGVYAVDCIIRLMNDQEIQEIEYEPVLYIGESCGCKEAVQKLPKTKRDTWSSTTSDEGYYSIHNYLFDDMLSAENLDEICSTIYEYIFHIKNVSTFDLCLNSQWLTPEKLDENDFPETGYTKKMLHAISYSTESPSETQISTDRTFDTWELLPDLDAHAGCKSFIFTPIYIDNESLGYAVVSFNSNQSSYDQTYRLWSRAVARGLEALRRFYIIEAYKKKALEKMPSKFPTSIDTQKGIKTKAMDISYEEVREIEEVEKILDQNRLTYHFQPIVSAVDGEIFSYEALMRSNSEWKIPPLQIIKQADVLNRISDVEKATFVNVLTIVGDHPEWFENKKVFINSIPGSKLEYNDFAQIEEMLTKFSSKVVVELTEQAELADEELDSLKQQYKRLGIGLAVDDYGTGYSNVSNLLRYLPDYVKIDRVLLTDIQNSSQKQHFVREAIDFCHANNIKALAEGVETAEELQTVIRLGADLIQGYYVARPTAEVIQSIDSNVKMEISRFHREKEAGNDEPVFIAGHTRRISLNALIKEGKSVIVVGEKDATFRDVSIVGTPGVKSNVSLEIKEGYDGRITLENVYLTSAKNRPCIQMADNSSLTVRLIGENYFDGGGVKVPESSRFIVEGDGNLHITCSASECYGIGNDFSNTNGSLEFYQDGEIDIELSGKCCIGIGSGKGGEINVNKGKYTININGEEGVGLGSFDGDAEIVMHDCDYMVDAAVLSGVGVGSWHGIASIGMWSSLVKVSGNGKSMCMVGTYSGKNAYITIHDMSLLINMKADESTAIGSYFGETVYVMDSAALKVSGFGTEAYIFGGVSETTDVDINNSDVRINLNSKTGVITKTPIDNIIIEHSRKRIVINGEEQI